jgi:hypothetical protein
MCNCLTRRSFLAVAPISLLGQSKAATIYGTIRVHTGQPASALAILVGPRFNYTDVNGYYRIVGVPYGVYNMQIRKGNRTLKQGQLAVNAARVLHDDVI